MKILYILGFMPPYIAREIEAMAKQGHTISVLLPEIKSNNQTVNLWNNISSEPNAKRIDIKKTLKFRYLTSSFYKLAFPLFKSLHHFSYLSKSIKEKEIKFFLIASEAINQINIKNKPDIIHAHFALDQAHIARIIASILKIPYTITTHATDIFVPRNNTRLKRILEEAAVVFTISEFNVKHINSLNIKPKRIVISKLGLDTTTLPTRNSALTKTSTSTQLICIASGLVQKKGVPDLIDAIKILKEKNVNCELTIIGSDPSKTILNKIRELTKTLPIHLPGVLTSAKTLALLSQANIFVLPCIEADNKDKDGIPVALMEAMGMGIPSISTSISGIPELIENNKTGILVSPNSPKELANAIYFLITNPEIAATLGKNSKEKIIQQHSLDKLASTLTNTMNSVLEENK